MLPALSGLEGKGRGCVCVGAGPHCAAGQHQAQAPAAGGAKLSRGTEVQSQVWGSGALQGRSCSHGHTGHGVRHPRTQQHRVRLQDPGAETSNMVMPAESMRLTGSPAPALPVTSSVTLGTPHHPPHLPVLVKERSVRTCTAHPHLPPPQGCPEDQTKWLVHSRCSVNCCCFFVGDAAQLVHDRLSS